MKNALAVLALLCVAILSAVQLLVLNGMPHSPNEDLARHVALALNFRDAMASGQWIPRIQILPAGAPDRLQDIPAFQYYGFLSSLLAQPGLMLGLSPVRSLVTGVIFARWLGALGMFANCQLLGLGRRAGILSAAAWLAFPYIQTTLYGRVAIPESVAQTLLPMLPLAWLLLAKGWGRIATITTSFSVLLLALAHPIFLLWGAGLHLAYAFYLLLRRQAYPALLVFSSLVAGLGLAAFQWLPADLTKADLGTPFLQVSPYDKVYLSSTSGIYGLPAAMVDGNAHYFFTVAIWTLPAGIAAFLLGWGDQRNRGMVTVITGALAAFLLLAYSPVDVWQFLPRISWATQFPYRLLSFVAVFGSLSFAYVCDGLLRKSLFLSGFMLTLAIMASGPALVLPHFPEMTAGDPRISFCSQDYIVNDSSRVVAGDGWLLKNNRVQIPYSEEPLHLNISGARSGLPGESSVLLEVVDADYGHVVGSAHVLAVPSNLSILLPKGVAAVILKPERFFRPSDVSASTDARELSIVLDAIAIAPQGMQIITPRMVERRLNGPYSRVFHVKPNMLTSHGAFIVELPMAFSRLWRVTQAGRELDASPNFAGLTSIRLHDVREDIVASYRLPWLVWLLQACGLIVCPTVAFFAGRMRSNDCQSP